MSYTQIFDGQFVIPARLYRAGMTNIVLATTPISFKIILPFLKVL
jgi:hypothetical protein